MPRVDPLDAKEKTYLQELVRNIHLNPLRDGVIPNLKILDSYR